MKTSAVPDRWRRSERDRVLMTPEGIALPLTLASRGARAGALLMDFIVIGVFMIATTVGLITIAGGSLALINRLEADSAAAGALEFLFVLWIVAMFLFRNAYFLFFELRPRGATPGKRMAGIRVASRDGGRLTVEMVVARNLLRDIELFLPLVFLAAAQAGGGDLGPAALAGAAWFCIFAFFPFFNRDRLRAGDLIAGSWVVEAPRRKLEQALSAAPSAVPGEAPSAPLFTDAELAVYGEYELQTLERLLRENQAETLATARDTIARKIGREPAAGDPRAFLDAYYRQLRARLEGGMLMGRRKADKHDTGGGR